MENSGLTSTNAGVVTLYAYDAAGQLTNEVTASATNTRTYDEAGNWLNAAAGSKWVYNADNEIAGRLPTATPGVTNITVTGEVEPEPDTSKWYNTWADCRGVSARVSLADGTFSLSNVPVDPETGQFFGMTSQALAAYPAADGPTVASGIPGCDLPRHQSWGSARTHFPR